MINTKTKKSIKKPQKEKKDKEAILDDTDQELPDLPSEDALDHIEADIDTDADMGVDINDPDIKILKDIIKKPPVQKHKNAAAMDYIPELERGEIEDF